jgi:DNA-binding Xre family transcriptional regulator
MPFIQGKLKNAFRVNCDMGKAKKKSLRKKAELGHFDHDKFLLNLGKRIKKLRKQNGFKSYELFAYDIEISRAGMSKYESNKFDDIRMRTLLKIIDGLGMTPKEFFSEGLE